jgi:hypothetical protein
LSDAQDSAAPYPGEPALSVPFEMWISEMRDSFSLTAAPLRSQRLQILQFLAILMVFALFSNSLVGEFPLEIEVLLPDIFPS